VHYFGTILGLKSATVGIILAASHTAAWLGASTNTRTPTWIQAGVEGSRPYAYVERGRVGKQTSLREWPVSSGHVAHVRLVRSGERWRVVIDGYRSVWARVPHAQTITTLETDGRSSALIDGRIVRGR
jgi:hypothetical protein